MFDTHVLIFDMQLLSFKIGAFVMVQRDIYMCTNILNAKVKEIIKKARIKKNMADLRLSIISSWVPWTVVAQYPFL